MKFLLSLLGICNHSNTTFPLTPVKSFRRSTYICCLDCGKEFEYDWKAFRIGREIREKSLSSVPVTAACGEGMKL
jgi:hypothetical protein